MKYILYWEIDPNRFNEAIEKLSRIVPDESGKFPNKLSESYSLGGRFKGFSLVEATPEQRMNLMVNVMPEMQVKLVSIIESPKVVQGTKEIISNTHSFLCASYLLVIIFLKYRYKISTN